MSSNKKSERKSGKRPALGAKPERRLLSINPSKLCRIQSQSFEDWETEGLLSPLLTTLMHLSALTVPQAISKGYLTVYTKVVFPPKSGFTWPKHIPKDIKWATFHLKPKSKEVIVGYLEYDIFYIVFLDREHLFWKCTLKNT